MSTLFLTEIHADPLGAFTLVADVPKRPRIGAQKFGAWLADKRGEKSLEQIAKKIRPLVEGVGLRVDRSTLTKIEKGRVPSWPMIGALSRVYNVPVEETIRQLVDALDFPAASDLLRHGAQLQQAPHQEVAVDPASARARELEDRIKAYEIILRNVGGWATQILDAVGAEGAAALDDERRRRRRHRKTG